MQTVAELASRSQNIETLQNAGVCVCVCPLNWVPKRTNQLCVLLRTVLLALPLTGVMQLLRPLLLDVVPGVQQTAALALGRLANYSDDLAESVVKGDILPQLVYSLAEQNVRKSIHPLPPSSSLCRTEWWFDKSSLVFCFIL